ncbi:MAG: hypothetical protein IK079_05460, partial [Desulfovibrio sp.]|nr:hypothetical protein [Desulfovibrio sp.]
GGSCFNETAQRIKLGFRFQIPTVGANQPPIPQVSLSLHRLTRLAQPPQSSLRQERQKGKEIQRCALYLPPEERSFTARWINTGWCGVESRQ